jgi:hypothetical protein
MEKSNVSSGKTKKKASGSAEGPLATPNPSVHVLLDVHLWSEQGGDVPKSAREMVRDLLSASPCEVRDGSSSSIMASFIEPALAVKTAWRLRRLVQGFSQASTTGYLGGCFILSSLEEAHPEPEISLVERFPVLTQGHSGQVLFVGTLCESARAIPGLQFEAVSDEWMTPEAIRLYRAVLQLSAPVQMEGYVEGPIECWAPAVESKPQVVECEEIAVQAVDAEAPALDQIMELAAELAAQPVMPASQEIGGFYRAQTFARRNSPLRWVAVGCAVVVALAAIAIRVSISRKSEAPVVQSPTLVRTAPASPKVVPAKAAISSNPATTVTDEGPKAAPNSNPQDVREVAKAKHKASSSTKGPSGGEGDTGGDAKKDGGDKTGIIFSPDEINRTIALADRESGDGKFDDAIRTYRIVLKHDPSNARAKEGMARAIRNRDSQ